MKPLAKLAVALAITATAAIGFVAAPIVYVETACRQKVEPEPYAAIITDAAWQRAEARTFMTYPEWHMVYAYEDFARILETGDEHAFDYGNSASSFWSSYCTLNRQADAHGGADWPTRQMIYTIGTSFDVEMGLKALYEETIGRAFAAARGPGKTPQDQVAAEMAQEYGAFLRQVPWYKFPFAQWTQRLWSAPPEGMRSWERRLALGGEWKAKQAYASLIGQAVAATGQDELRIRSVVMGLSPDELNGIEGVVVVSTQGDRSIVESDRYAAFTQVVSRIAEAHGEMVEIAGNDDIMVSVLRPSGAGEWPSGLGSIVTRFGRDDGAWTRSLVLMKVGRLADCFRRASGETYTVEHVFDY